MGTLQSPKERLLARKKELTKEISIITAGLNNSQEYLETDEQTNRERLRIFNAELQDIIESLKLIQNGQYGICQECGNKIPQERLAATHSPFCVACQEVRDRNVGHQPRRSKKFVPSTFNFANPHSWT